MKNVETCAVCGKELQNYPIGMLPQHAFCASCGRAVCFDCDANHDQNIPTLCTDCNAELSRVQVVDGREVMVF